ncbi:MAG: hypothetical protein WC043_08735 [Pseudobdellovibrionaceae bacterium]
MGSFSAHAEENLKTLAHDICHAYLDHPEEFKPIEMTSCEVFYYNSEQLIDGECFTYNNEQYVRFGLRGACATYPIMHVNSKFNAQDMVVQNKSRGYNTLTDTDNAFNYKGHLILSSGNDMRLVQGQTQTLLCKFRTKIYSWKSATPVQNPICQKLSANDYFIQHHHSLSNENYPELSSGETAQKKFTADFDQDGKKETYLQYRVNGSGMMCHTDTTMLFLLNNNSLVDYDYRYKQQDTPANEKLLGLALYDLTDPKPENVLGLTYPFAPTLWEIITINKKDYLLADQEEPKFPELVQKDIARALYEFRGNRFEKICEQRTNSEKVIQHEAIPRKYWNNLDYKPIE